MNSCRLFTPRQLAAKSGLVALLLGLASTVCADFDPVLLAKQSGQGNHRMIMNETGMVMNYNTDVLPEDCERISRDYEFTIMAGTKYAKSYADTVFGFSEHEWRVEPCSRITVIFKNEDDVRHQWMVHGLPKYLYDQGMFHMEAMGGQTLKGVFIVPSDDRTYLAHCDIAQHMEKGMKGQLVVGGGDGDLWSIPGLTANFERPQDGGFSARRTVLFLGLAILSCIVLAGFLSRHGGKQ